MDACVRREDGSKQRDQIVELIRARASNTWDERTWDERTSAYWLDETAENWPVTL